MTMNFFVVVILGEHGETTNLYGPFTSKTSAERFQKDIEDEFSQEDMEAGYSAKTLKLERPTKDHGRTSYGCKIEIEL